VTAFTWDVRVDGSPIAGIVPQTGTITTGRQTVFEQPDLPLAIIELQTVDVRPEIASRWPEFALGAHSVASGFLDTYADAYAGGRSRITTGAPVTVTARTPSAFVDTYEADYTAGLDLLRFTGVVQAIDYAWDIVRLTCLPTAEAWTRILVGGTTTTPIAQETDTDRVQRLCDEAGVTIQIDGPDGPEIIPIPADTEARPLWEQLQEIANDCRALLYVDRAGTVHYRTRSRLHDSDISYTATVPYSYTREA
jgi:hypothetical protein